MMSNNKYCQHHQKHQAIWFCIAPHNCQRKYCEICKFQHGEHNQFLHINEFKEQYIKVLKDQIYLYKDNEYIIQIENAIRILFEEIEKIYKTIDHLKKFIQTFEIESKLTDNLVYTNLFPNELSSDTLNKIIELKQTQKLYGLINQKNSYLKNLSKFLHKQKKLCNSKLYEEINMMTQTIRKKFEKNFTFAREEITENAKQNKILTNYEFLKYFKWKGESEQDSKVGMWTALWNGEVLSQVGAIQQWIKVRIMGGMCKKIFLEAIVYEIGEYHDDFRIGKWNYVYKNIKIGGGHFEAVEGVQTQKGKWIELNDGFRDSSQVIFSGEYKNSKKVGRWEIMYRETHLKPFNGGGQYDEKGIKVGRWIDICDDFYDKSQVTYDGEYQNGKKVGKWNTWLMYYKDGWRNEIIGGGLYDDGGHEIKIGKWTELKNGFNNFSQITYNGEYQIGKKIGKWVILWQKDYGDFNNEQIGGGSYKDGIKIGEWIELSDQFRYSQQVIYHGQYKDGQKIGEWARKKRGDLERDFKKIQELRYD